jgi:hypothetical protein
MVSGSLQTKAPPPGTVVPELTRPHPAPTSLPPLSGRFPSAAAYQGENMEDGYNGLYMFNTGNSWVREGQGRPPGPQRGDRHSTCERMCAPTLTQTHMLTLAHNTSTHTQQHNAHARTHTHTHTHTHAHTHTHTNTSTHATNTQHTPTRTDTPRCAQL